MPRKKKKQKYVNKFGVGLLLGAGTGYLISRLTAPKKGEELQSDLSDKAQEWKEKAEQATDKVKNKTNELKDKAKDMTGYSSDELDTTERPEKPTPPLPETDPLPMDFPEEDILEEVIIAESTGNLLDDHVEDGTPID